MPEKKLYLLQFSAIHMAKLCACSPEIMRCEVSELQTPRAAPDYILDGVSDMPDPQAVPCRLTALKTRPVVTDAAVSHLSTALFTQIGMGTVRTWLPLPTRSTIAQSPCRICDVFLRQGRQLGSAQAAAEQDRYHSDVSDMA